jgi:hypothetical protein
LGQYKNAKRWELASSRPVEYTEGGIKLADGMEIEADVIVWGTGFEPTKFFERAFPGVDLQDCLDDGLYLYKYIAHPSLKNCFFIGFKDPSLNVPFNASLQSTWAALCAGGVVNVPDAEKMSKLLEDRRRDTRMRFPFSHRRGFYDYFLRPPNCDYTYALDLIKDCGLENRMANFWRHPVNIWTISSNFRAVIGMQIHLLKDEKEIETNAETAKETTSLLRRR